MASYTFVHSLCCLAVLRLASAGQLTVLQDGHLSNDDQRGALLIPSQLVMTGKESSIDEMKPHIRANVRTMLELNPEIKLRYLSDIQCRNYVRQHCESEIAEAYMTETAGHFRGDICRACVLSREGGFYADVDLQPRVPFASLADESTTFMSVFTTDGAILNALMGTVPDGAVMRDTLQQIKKYYSSTDGGKHKQGGGYGEWMGTMTLKSAMENVIKAHCPETNLESKMHSVAQSVSVAQLQWQCGKEAFRFYHEKELDCPGNVHWKQRLLQQRFAGKPTQECPRERMTSPFAGLRYGIFTPGQHKKLIAWSRAVGCSNWWCGGR